MADLLFAPGADLRGAAGSYRIESFLGRGGFGETYRARADGSGADVTVKVLRLERLDSWKALDLFDREARALAGLDHPRLPRLVELFVTDGKQARALAAGETVMEALEPGGVRVVLVQTYVPGTSLGARIDGGMRLSPPEADQLCRDLLEILDYLHGRDPPIIHRDVKPSNIIIDAEGRAHLIDFGAIQLRLRSAEEVGSTMVGTMGYFPHEQILGRAVPASDLYALGMTAVVALTGKPPEEQPHDAATGLVKAPAGLPPPLARLLLAVLQPAPGQRPQTARAALDLLEGRFAMVPHAPAQPPAAPRAPGYPVLSPGAKAAHKVLFAVTGGAGLAAAALVNVVWFNSFSETKLVAMAPFWVTPIVFGAAGLLSLPRRTALPRAVVAGGVGLALLFFFLYGIFPAL